MAEESDEATLSVQIANQIISVANNRLEEGISPIAIAAGLRHAAANFSAFVDAHAGEQPDPEPYISEFLNRYGYYLDRHRPQQPTGGGLLQTIRQVEDDS